MKSNSLFRHLALLAAVALAVVTLHRTAPAAVGQREVASSPVGTHIAHIENGLLSSVVIKGQPPATMKLTDRMQHYHVPGVSIAFFDHGQIVWARGY
jgi:hypothetical protein